MSMQLRPETQELLDQIRALPLFHSLGTPCSLGYKSVKSWSEALRSSSTSKWENVTLTAKNLTAENVCRKDWNRYQQWNPVCVVLRPLIEDIIANGTKEMSSKFKLTDKFKASVQWDFLLILLEKEFDDIYPPLFLLPTLYPIYQSGHFPCGWTGPKLDSNWSGTKVSMPPGEILVY